MTKKKALVTAETIGDDTSLDGGSLVTAETIGDDDWGSVVPNGPHTKPGSPVTAEEATEVAKEAAP